MYNKKSGHKKGNGVCFFRYENRIVMNHEQYDDDFKKFIVNLIQNGKTQVQISKEYGISLSAISRWIKLYSTVTTEDSDILPAKQVKDLQKRLLQLEEDLLSLPSKRLMSKEISPKALCFILIAVLSTPL